MLLKPTVITLITYTNVHLFQNPDELLDQFGLKFNHFRGEWLLFLNPSLNKITFVHKNRSHAC